MRPMHNDAIPSDAALAAALVARQMPQLAHLPIAPVATSGTDNVMYRLGDRLALRLPRRPSAAALLVKEAHLLPRITGLPLAVPMPRYLGQPSTAFPHAFSVVDWIEGASADQMPTTDMRQAARDLATFLTTLQAHDTTGCPVAGETNHRRGVPLAELAAEVDRCVSVLADEIDAPAARQVWRCALGAADKTAARRLLHGDLKADNLLMRDNRLVAVLDWGLAAVGDPAVDQAVAWTWLDSGAAEAFQRTVYAPDQSWVRARGWALYSAVIALEYYRETTERPARNPALVATSRATLARLVLRR